MKMRSVWLLVVVLATLYAAAAANTLRSSQIEGGSRSRRRFTSPSTSDVDSPSQFSSSPAAELSTTTLRSTRRRVESLQSDATRPTTRSRTRSKVAEPNVDSKQSPQIERNERFSKSRINVIRTRKKPIENKVEVQDDRTDNVEFKEQSTVRSRQRPNYRHSLRQMVDITPSTDENKHQMVNNAIDKSNSPDVLPSTIQFKPRSRSTTPIQPIENTTPKRIRSRINTRTLITSNIPDHATSGSTVSEHTLPKDPSTERTTDSRNSRKLRYRTKLSQTNDVSIGQGITENNTVIKSSQNREDITSQKEIQTSTVDSLDSAHASGESTSSPSLQSTSPKPAGFVRRPLPRGKGSLRPISIPKPKQDKAEINEDDNYPESFKALLQSKNAAPQPHSPLKESLSVIASQKIYKTHSPPSQSTNTETETAQNRRRLYKQTFQNKTTKADANENIIKTTSTETSITTKQFKRPNFKNNRTSYLPRYRKGSTFDPSTTTTTTTPLSNIDGSRTRYKYNRKLKIQTTEPSKANRNVINVTQTNTQTKNPLPRTSYYSRLRNSKIGTKTTEKNDSVLSKEVGSTESNVKQFSNESSDHDLKKFNIFGKEQKYRENELENGVSLNIVTNDEISVTEPLNYFHSRNLNKSNMLSLDVDQNSIASDGASQNNIDIMLQNDNERVIINKNEIISKTDNAEIYQMMVTTSKYHSSYRDDSEEADVDKTIQSTKSPPIRNINTRKFENQNQKTSEIDTNDDINVPSKTHLKKYTNILSKNSDAVKIDVPGRDNLRGRYSSRYRGPIDRPMYMPTVPSVTPSSAWLKFYVTDKQLTKSFHEPNWFAIEEQFTTPAVIGHYIIATTPIIHVPSIELVEGEESQLGPDMNSISFSQTRSTLTSADLKLSESVIASSHLVNVEASHHSPSVTVSIFDALAEILTSTPKPQLSSTTEVSMKNNKNEVQINTPNGVSNKINVNSIQTLEGEEISVSTITGRNTPNKSVQITDQITPNVINSLSVGNNTIPLTTVQKSQPLESTTINPPIPIPTTSIPARKPFAIKILYSNTEPPIDKLVTAPEFTPNWSTTTDNPPMVFNTVSDLILSNNKVVSSELTSMLSNNIKNILENVDPDARTRLSADMANLLKTLIPRALDGLSVKSDDVDFTPNTTPYSLEEIRDTAINIDFNNNVIKNTSTILTDNLDIKTSNLSQSIGNNSNVNIENIPTTLDTGLNINVSSPVNSSIGPVNISSSESVTFWTSILSTVDSFTENSPQIQQNASDSPDNIESRIESVPIFTNWQITNDVNTTVENNQLLNNLTFDNLELLENSTESDDLNAETPVLINPANLWLLSKKASVLKLIEDLIQQHNIEIATIRNPSSDIVANPVSSLSERLSEMVLNLNMIANNTTNENITDELTSNFTVAPTIQPSTSTPSIFPITLSSRLASNTITSEGLPITETIVESTTMTLNLVDGVEDVSNVTGVPVTTILNDVETTTVDNENSETTTQVDAESTTLFEFETTTLNSLETSTNGDLNTAVQNNVSVATGTTVTSSYMPPKKDYVIFGILPNNTVVRKDPNDNPLESLTEASPYIIYGVLPNNTIIRKFPNGTRVPRVMQKIDILPISPWSLRNPYSPIHNNPAIVKPRSNPIQVSTNVMTSTDATNNGSENRLTTDTVNNNQVTISTKSVKVIGSSFGLTTVTNKSPAETSTASHVLSLRTTTMLPSVDEILLNSISSAAKEDMVITTMPSTTREPRILTLDIDPETKQIRTEKPNNGMGGAVFKFIPIDEVTVPRQNSNVFKLASTKAPSIDTIQATETMLPSTETNTQIVMTGTEVFADSMTTSQPGVATPLEATIQLSTLPTIANIETTFNTQVFTNPTTTRILTTTGESITESESTKDITNTQLPTTSTISQGVTVRDETTINLPIPRGRSLGNGVLNQEFNSNALPFTTTTAPLSTLKSQETQTDNVKQLQDDAKFLQALLSAIGRNPNINLSGIANIQTNKPTGMPSIDDDIKKFEEDTTLLKALLAATGQSPANLNKILNTKSQVVATTTMVPATTTTTTTRTTTTVQTTTAPTITTNSIEDDIKKFQEDAKLLQALLQATGQNPADLNIPIIPGITSNVRVGTNPTTIPTTTRTNKITTAIPTTNSPFTTTPSIQDDIKKFQEDTKLLQALLQATGRNPADLNIPIIPGITSNVRVGTNPTTIPTTSSKAITTEVPTTKRTNSIFTTTPSIQDDIKKFQEDTKLLQALLQATGQNPADLNIPIIPGLKSNVRVGTNPTTIPTTSSKTITTEVPTTKRTNSIFATTPSIQDDIKKIQEDTNLLQALLQATGQNPANLNLPIISGVTSNVRIASNPLTTSVASNTPTTTPSARPVFTSRTQRTRTAPTSTVAPNPSVPVTNTLQTRRPQVFFTTTEDIGISTTVQPLTNQRKRLPNAVASQNIRATTASTGRRLPVSTIASTTESPSSSTFSVEEDLAFLQNLKSVLNTNSVDPETALANRVVALAVERSLNEIETKKQTTTPRSGKSISGFGLPNRIPTTVRTTTSTTPRPTTTTPRPTTTIRTTTPSIEDDIKQFEEDTKLLKALIKATGQDPSKFNIPSLSDVKTNVKNTPSKVQSSANDDLKLLSTLLASPSPLNEPFDSLIQKPVNVKTPTVANAQTSKTRNGAAAITKDDIKLLQEDPKFLQSLLQLQGQQENASQKNKLAISGLTGDEALTKLLKQTTMVSEATRAPLAVSTEYGKSNDALLAALLKEQGFGPTTASSLDEQIRLAALLNQVVVTPKARPTTTAAPAPRRPILDGLSWLWQQWRDTAPGPPRQNRKPAPTVSSAATSNRANWFGSGPFVGNAPETPTSNRIPLEPPRAVAAEQTPGRGQLVSAAINVSRAFSQFLGAAIQGAAQTVQNVIKAGQKAATDVYSNGSG